MMQPTKYTPQQLAAILGISFLYGAGTTDPNCCSACTLENTSCVWHEQYGYEPYFEQRNLVKDGNPDRPVYIRRAYVPHHVINYANNTHAERLTRSFMNLPGGELK